MTRAEFLSGLRARLSGFSEEDVNKSTSYFSEIISDKTEDGMTEEEAVASLGSLDEIANRILMEAPMTQVIKTKMTKKLPTLALVLLIVGSPVWLALALAAAAIVLALYVCVWVAAVSLWTVVAALITGGLAATVSSVIFFGTNAQTALFALGAGLLCMGIGLLLIFAAIEVTRGCVMATKFVTKTLKSGFVGRSKAE